MSEQYLEQQPEGYMGGDIAVPAALGMAAGNGGAGASGSAPSTSRSSSSRSSSGGDVEAPSLVEVRLRPAASASVQLARANSSKVAGVDRSATGLAASAPGASRWGASYWTQVGASQPLPPCHRSAGLPARPARKLQHAAMPRAPPASPTSSHPTPTHHPPTCSPTHPPSHPILVPPACPPHTPAVYHSVHPRGARAAL